MAPRPKDKRARGTARVAFVAHIDTIVADLQQGHTVLSAYQRHHRKLGQAISYPQFVRYVRQLRDNGVIKPLFGQPAPRTPLPATTSLPPSPIGPKPLPAQPVQGALSPNARHQSRPRTFSFDGNPKQDDKSRLIGRPGREPKR